MLKSFTPVATIILLCLFKVERPSKLLVVSVVGISFGTSMAVAGEVHMNMIGLSAMIISEFAEASRVVLTQVFLCNLHFGVIEGLYFLAPISACFLLILICFTELPVMISTNDITLLWEQSLMFCGLGTMGIFVNVLYFLVIRFTSSVTLKVIYCICIVLSMHVRET